jgi:hypothetical protein
MARVLFEKPVNKLSALGNTRVHFPANLSLSLSQEASFLQAVYKT